MQYASYLNLTIDFELSATFEKINTALSEPYDTRTIIYLNSFSALVALRVMELFQVTSLPVATGKHDVDWNQAILIASSVMYEYAEKLWPERWTDEQSEEILFDAMKHFVLAILKTKVQKPDISETPKTLMDHLIVGEDDSEEQTDDEVESPDDHETQDEEYRTPGNSTRDEDNGVSSNRSVQSVEYDKLPESRLPLNGEKRLVCKHCGQLHPDFYSFLTHSSVAHPNDYS